MTQDPQTLALSSSLTGAAELIEELGASPLQIADESGLMQDALYDPELPVKAIAVARFLELAAERCNCRHFGISLAGRQGWQVLGPLWLLIQQAETLKGALEDLAANFGFVTTATTIDLQPDPSGLAVCYEPLAAFKIPTIQAVELGLAIASFETRRIVGPDWRPFAAQFRYAAPQFLAAHTAAFGPHVLFEQDRNAIIIDKDTLEAPVSQSQTRAHDLFEVSFRNRAALEKQVEEYRVEAAIRALLPHSQCSLSSVAKLLGLSERTLQHYLQQRNLSFQKILNDVRLSLAEKYLTQSSLRVSQIAELLQYSETSAFSRFIKTNLGSSPSEIRNSQPGQRSI